MSAAVHIEMNILSSMFCILLYYQQKRHRVFDFLGSTTFNSLLWSAVGVMAVDIISVLFMSDLLPHTDAALMLVQTVYYLIQTILPFFFMLYCINTTGTDTSGTTKLLLSVPILFTLVVLVINTKTNFAFYIEDNIVLRGEGYLLAIITPMLYIAASLLLCLSFYLRTRNDTQERRKIAFHMLMCVGICFAGALSCAFISYLSPWHVFVGALIYLYIQLHSYREQSLDILAYTDSLTGLKNYAAYSYIREKIAQKMRSVPDYQFAIAVMDVNDLKKVNDAYGHKSGDALLICASKFMCDIFDHSPVCRIGGDEFAAILEGSDYENRDQLFCSFMQQIKNTTYLAGDTNLTLSAALGMCAYSPEKHSSFDDVFQEADRAMYENKDLCKKHR